MDDDHARPEEHFIHTQASHVQNRFFFHAFGNTPPVDLLQHIPHDAPRADILSLGCGDLRDVLYSILLHGRRTICGGPNPRPVSFILNDWEPAIQARNLVLLQLILDSRHLLEAAHIDGIAMKVAALGIGGEPGKIVTNSGRADVNGGNRGGAARNGKAGKEATVTADTKKGRSVDDVAFAERIGVIFSAMYNMYVDGGVMQIIQDVAGKLVASATSQGGWSSTELGRYVHFADDRSQARVCDILALYRDGNLQGRMSSVRVKRERAAFVPKNLARIVKDGKISLPQSMGLASFRQVECTGAYSSMKQQYIKEGLLNPFALLLKTEKEGGGSRGPRDLVNPLLLVTERKGLAYSLHYAAFPLDAFHTDVACWKLRDESLQDDHGKLAPRVTKRQDFHIADCMDGSAATAKTRRGMQNAWFGTALEELAQMCGAFLQATTAMQAHLSLTVQVGDALNFCDALVSARSLGVGDSTNGTFKPLAFQQGTLQPLQLRPEYCGELSTGFDVINTSNLADHLGIVNLLVAASPLLGYETHSVVLTTYMASVGTHHLHQTTEEFCEKLLCMSPSTAAVLLGVVPVSSLSTVAGHTDTDARLMDSKLCGRAGGQPGIMRLTWKSPAGTMQPRASAVPRADITPEAFVKLTHPVYKAMFSHMPTEEMLAGGFWEPYNHALGDGVSVKHYTPASFGRLLASAGRFLRLGTRHFKAALHAIVTRSDRISARNLVEEKIVLFHSLGLVPMDQPGGMPVIPLDTRRVVLLVPESGLSLLRLFKGPQVYLALRRKHATFCNHFGSVHVVYVRVRRGGDRSNTEDAGTWWSLSDHLAVQDAKESDHDAELMVSAVVPTVMLELAPAAHTELQLRPRDSEEMRSEAKVVLKRFGGQLSRVFYRADLANTDRTAILLPGYDDSPRKSGNSTALLPCPKVMVVDRRHVEMPSLAQRPQGITHEPPILHRTVWGKFLFDQSLELTVLNGRSVYRVTLVMANENARELLADGGVAPIAEHGQGYCYVQLKFGDYRLTHPTHFPFPVEWKSINIKLSKHQGYVLVTVPALKGPVQAPFSMCARTLRGDNGSPTILPSSWCFAPCVPLRCLPKLDFNAEWAHEKAMGSLSFTSTDRAAVKNGSIHTKGVGVHSGLIGLKENLLRIASAACTKHDDDRPIWKHPWMCITENGSQGEPAIWIWVNNVLLDSSNEAIVLDCCILPVDQTTVGPSLHLGAAIERSAVLGSSSYALLEAYPAELELWGRLLPVAVERARQTYRHRSDCLYTEKGSTAASAACGCGKGQDLPPSFVESMTSVYPMADGVRVESLFYRAALSPLYAPPGKSFGQAKVEAAAGGTAPCAECGRGGAAMLCSRCRKVQYCSKECQRQHWKSHKKACHAN